MIFIKKVGFYLFFLGMFLGAGNNGALGNTWQNTNNNIFSGNSPVNLSVMHMLASTEKTSEDNGIMDGMMKGSMMQSMMNDHMRRSQAFDDTAFLSAMMAHFTTSMGMAKAVLEKGKDPQVKKWAEKTLAEQNKEMKEIRSQLEHLGGENEKTTQNMKDNIHSMMSLPGSINPDNNFVSMMIGHHAGVVGMGVSAIIGTQNPQVSRLARQIVDTQLNEIEEYKAWLAAKK